MENVDLEEYSNILEQHRPMHPLRDEDYENPENSYDIGTGGKGVVQESRKKRFANSDTNTNIINILKEELQLIAKHRGHKDNSEIYRNYLTNHGTT